MAYEFKDGEFVWTDPFPEPVIGMRKTDYLSGIRLGDGEEDDEKIEVTEAAIPGILGLIGAAVTAGVTVVDWWNALMGDESTIAPAGAPGNGGVSMSNGSDVDLYGRSGVVMNGGGVPVGGPGVPEPPAAMVAHHWSVEVHSKAAGTFNLWFFKLVDGRMMCFNPAKNTWKMWRPVKPLAVMYRGKTSLSQAVKVQKYLDKMWHTVAKKTKALKLA